MWSLKVYLQAIPHASPGLGDAAYQYIIASPTLPVPLRIVEASKTSVVVVNSTGTVDLLFSRLPLTR